MNSITIKTHSKKATGSFINYDVQKFEKVSDIMCNVTFHDWCSFVNISEPIYFMLFIYIFIDL